MLVTLKEILKIAEERQIAVGSFNTPNMTSIKAVIGAAEELGQPVIIMHAQVHEEMGLCKMEEIVPVMLMFAGRAKVPVCVHLDHGTDIEYVKKGLELGFTSVMYDCSTDTYENNLKKVKEMADIAHSYGATLEAELGHVGEAAGPDPSAFYTDPAQALEFVQHTGCDALAIAVGTAHGAYKFPPKLDFARIETIAAQMDTPLVLHGGSGLTDEDFRHAIASGISKINIFTDINAAYAEGAKKALAAGAVSATDMFPYLVEAVKEATDKKMKLFSMK